MKIENLLHLWSAKDQRAIIENKTYDEIVTGPFSVLRTLKNDTVVKRAPADAKGGKGGPGEKK